MEAICHQYNFVLKNTTAFKMINSSCSWTYLVLAYPTLLLNLLLIISLVRLKEMNKPCGLLILNLAITDLLNGFFAMPLFYMVFRFIAEDKDPCLFVNIAMPCFIAATSESFIIVTLIAVERYISILHPFVHVSKLSRRNVAICVTISWISSILVIIPLLVGENVATRMDFLLLLGLQELSLIYIAISEYFSKLGIRDCKFEMKQQDLMKQASPQQISGSFLLVA